MSRQHRRCTTIIPFLRCFIASLVLIAAPAVAATAQARMVPRASAIRPPCLRQPVALVLSGGGAAGLAHIGVIRAIEEAGVSVELVVGTSMGAALGAMFASGYTARQLDSLASARPLDNVFRGYGPRLPDPLDQLPTFVALQEREGSMHLAASLVDERELYDVLNTFLLRGNALAGGRFDRMPVPFRAVATDLTRGKTVVLDRGDLAQAVRASLSIPVVMPPVEVDGRWLVDGGLTANVPADVAREWGARTLIVSDATEVIDPTEIDPLSQVDALRVIANRSARQPLSLSESDIVIRPHLAGVPRWTFSDAWRAVAIAEGYRAAAAKLARSVCPAGPSSVLRFAADEPRPEGRPTSELGRDDRTTVDLSYEQRARVSLGACRRDPGCLGVILNPSERGDSVTLDPAILRMPRREIGIGGAYRSGWGPRAWLGFVDRSMYRGGLTLGLAVAGGPAQQQASISVLARRPAVGRWTPIVRARLAREVDPLSERRTSRDGAWTLSVDAGVRARLDPLWVIWLGPELSTWRDPLEHWVRPALAFGLDISRAGSSGAPDVLLSALVGPRHGLGHVVLRRPFGTFTRITPEIRLGWGTGLPEARRFNLGGADGFPGLKLGERRDDLEAMARLTGSRRVAGALGVSAEGAVAHLGPSDTSPWLAGLRVGLFVDTPIGPASVAYGINSSGRKNWDFRIARWY